MKVLLISPLPPPAGGIASWTAAVLREAVRLDDVEITHVDTAVRWRSTNDLRMRRRMMGGILQAVRDSGSVYRSVKALKPDVAHLCTSGSIAFLKDLLILAILHRLGVGSILHFRMGRLPAIIEHNGWEWTLAKLAMRRAGRVMVLDGPSQERVSDTLPDVKPLRIPNPVDVRAVEEAAGSVPSPGSDGPKRVVFAGHVIPAKGIRELVEACLSMEGNSPRLDLVGEVEDDFRQELARSAAKRENGAWLKFTGQLRWLEAVRLISRADVFALPSYTEGFPNVVLEAMVLRRPIVATRVGAIPEMLNGRGKAPCGLLVNPGSVGELLQALSYFVKNGKEAAEMGARARARAEEDYSFGTIMGRYVESWRECARAQANGYRS